VWEQQVSRWGILLTNSQSLPNHITTISVVEMLDIPDPAKAVLSRRAAVSRLAPGIEEEIYKLIANYMFQHTMYARTISVDRLSRRLSAFTAQVDLLQYSALFSLDELAANLDSIMFMTSSENTDHRRFYELDHLRRSLETRHAHYLQDVQALRLTRRGGGRDTQSVTAAIAALERRRAAVMEQSTVLVDFLKHLGEQGGGGGSEGGGKAAEQPGWYTCPDSVEEEYLTTFTQVQSDLYQKKDNEYVIANSVAMMSFYSFHSEKKAAVWN
jgi:hypothetical protein